MTTVFNFYTFKSDDVCNDEAILITYALQIAIDNPQHQFVFLTNEDAKELNTLTNVIVVVIKKVSSNSTLFVKSQRVIFHLRGVLKCFQ